MLLRPVLLICIVCGHLYFLIAQDHSKILLQNISHDDIHVIQALGIPLDCGGHLHQPTNTIGGSVQLTLELSKEEVAQLINSGFHVDTLIEDLESFYAGRAARDLPKALQNLAWQKTKEPIQSRNAGQDLGCFEEEFVVPEHFQLGSMGGFLTYEQILETLDSMQILYPELISTRQMLSDSLLTIEGRPVFYVKISDHVENDEPEPEVLYTGVHHAREPASAMNLLFFMWYLLENYDSNPEIQSLVNHRELYFVPVLNPDGYLRNQKTHPAGGGMWRKNLRQNPDGTIGVDLNRNYGFKWGLDNRGSSPSTASNTFRGKNAFSEPETRMMKEFVEHHSFRTAFHNHSYSNLLLTPWSYSNSINEKDDLYQVWGNHMTWFNRYRFGQTSQILYLVNGGASDWFLGEQEGKDKIYAFTPEIGSNNEGGFWPSPLHIVSQCQRQMRMSLLLAYYAGDYALLHDLTPMSLGGLKGELHFSLERLGLGNGDFQLHIRPISPFLSIPSTTVDITDLDLMNQQMIRIPYELDARIWPGEAIEFEVILSNSSFDLYSATFSKTFRMTSVFSEDEAAARSGLWEGTWQQTDEEGFMDESSWTDSPYRSYEEGEHYMKLSKPLDAKEYSELYAEFYTKWELDRQSDWFHFSASLDDDTYYPFCGRYTRNRPEYSYDMKVFGRQTDWVLEHHEMNGFEGRENIWLKMNMKATPFDHGDGVYIDDLNIWGVYDCEQHQAELDAKITFPSHPARRDGSIEISIEGGISEWRYRWSTGDTTKDVRDLEAGEYTLAYTDASACQYTQSFTLKRTWEEESEMYIYPNPASDHVDIFAGQLEPSPSWTLRLSSILGQDIAKWPLKQQGDFISERIILENYPAGLYILSLSNGKQQWTEKLVIY